MHQPAMTVVKAGHQHNTQQIRGLKQAPHDRLNGGESPGNVHMLMCELWPSRKRRWYASAAFSCVSSLYCCIHSSPSTWSVHPFSDIANLEFCMSCCMLSLKINQLSELTVHLQHFGSYLHVPTWLGCLHPWISVPDMCLSHQPWLLPSELPFRNCRCTPHAASFSQQLLWPDKWGGYLAWSQSH